MAVQNKKRKAAKSEKDKVKKAKKTKDPLERLEHLARSNFFVTLKNSKDSNVPEFLRKSLNIDEFSLIEDSESSDLFLAFNAQVSIDNKSECFGVIIGPNAESERDKVSEFYELWGKQNCNLRRFQDGQTYESVSLKNPSGLCYLPLAKLKHLLNVHYPKVQPNFHHFNEELRTEFLRCHEKLLENRKFVDGFATKLREVCGYGSEMPLRKIEPVCSCLYKGDLKNHYHFVKNFNSDSKIVQDKNGVLLLKEKSNLVPPKLTGLSIELEISQKATMSSMMFARLKIAYALKLKEILEQKMRLKTCLIQDGQIYVIYESCMFLIKIKSPNVLTLPDFVLQEKLRLIALHNLAFSGLCSIVHKWLSNQFLFKTIDAKVVDMLIGAVFSQAKNPIYTVEHGFLQFLKLLSFHNFAQDFLILGPKDEIDEEKLAKFLFEFKSKRNQFPEVVIISCNDLESSWTGSLHGVYLQRLINCARLTLHKLTQSLDFDGILKFQVSEDQFDAIVELKPFQIPSDSKHGTILGDTLPTFPIVDYEPLSAFWNEITACFEKDAQFYMNGSLLKIGIKFNKPEQHKAIMEDIHVLGKDLIKHTD